MTVLSSGDKSDDEEELLKVVHGSGVFLFGDVYIAYENLYLLAPLHIEVF